MMGHKQKAIEILSRAEELGMAKSWRTYFALAKLYSDHPSDSKSQTYLEKALELSGPSSDVVIPYYIGFIELTHQDHVERVKILNDLYEKYPSDLILFSLAKCQLDMKEYKLASSTFKKIKNPRLSQQAKVNIAIISYQHLSSIKNAKKSLLTLSDSNELSQDEVMEIHFHIGNIYSQQKNSKLAKKHYLKAIVSARDDLKGPYLKRLTRELRSTNSKDILLDTLIAASKKLGGLSTVHALAGEVLTQDLGRHKDAIPYYNDAILLNPSSDHYNGLGIAHYNIKNYETALTAFSNAAELNPDDAIARYNEACVLALLGRKSEAIGSLKLALSMNPSLKLSAVEDEDFNSIKSAKEFNLLVDIPDSIPVAH